MQGLGLLLAFRRALTRLTLRGSCSRSGSFGRAVLAQSFPVCPAADVPNLVLTERVNKTLQLSRRNHCPSAKRSAYAQVARINLPVDPGFVPANRGACFSRRVRQPRNGSVWTSRLLNSLLFHARSRLQPRGKNQLPICP